MDGFQVTPADLQAAERDLLAYRAPAGLDTFVSSNPALTQFPDPDLTEALTGLVGSAASQLQEAARMIPAMAQGPARHGRALSHRGQVARAHTGPRGRWRRRRSGGGGGNPGGGGHTGGNGPR